MAESTVSGCQWWNAFRVLVNISAVAGCTVLGLSRMECTQGVGGNASICKSMVCGSVVTVLAGIPAVAGCTV